MSVCLLSISLHTLSAVHTNSVILQNVCDSHDIGDRLIFLQWFTTWMIDFSQHMLVFNSSNEVLIRVFFLVGTIFATAAHCSNFVHASNLSVIVAIHSFIILEFKYTAL